MNKEHLCPVCANPIIGYKDFTPGQSVFCKFCQAELAVIFKKNDYVLFQHLLVLDEDWRAEENNKQIQYNLENEYGMELSVRH